LLGYHNEIWGFGINSLSISPFDSTTNFASEEDAPSKMQSFYRIEKVSNLKGKVRRKK